MIYRSFAILFLSLFLFSSTVLAAPASSETFGEKLTKADKISEKDEWNKAETLYLAVTESPKVEERIQAYGGLSQLYHRLHRKKQENAAEKKLKDEKEFLASLVPSLDSYYQTYQVKKGDTYAKLVARDAISLEWFKRVNNDQTLKPGKVIHIPKIHYVLLVDKKKKTLTWKRGSETLKVYLAAIGKEGTETPAGEFQIVNKVMHPVWYKLKQQFPPDSPKNLLGTRWMGLNKKSYGIHGTRNPASIGEAASHGCIRMYNHDVEELFDWIPIGTQVVISD